MTPHPGCRVAIAPRFHLDPDWPNRLRFGAGVAEEDGRFFPRGPWRPPTADELGALTVGDIGLSSPGPLPMLGEAAPSPADAVWLFQLPAHLRSAWWELLDAAAGSDMRIQGFDAFASRVAEFLAYKQLHPPDVPRMEAIVAAAGERSIRRDPDTGRPSGLGSAVAPWSAWPPAADVAVERLWGVVNLGDEDTGVVLVGPPLPRLAAEVARATPGSPAPTAVGELVERFLRAFPDHPPVRVRLGPGEGCRLPADGLVLDGDPTGKQDPDVLLLVSAG